MDPSILLLNCFYLLNFQQNEQKKSMATKKRSSYWNNVWEKAEWAHITVSKIARSSEYLSLGVFTVLWH